MSRVPGSRPTSQRNTPTRRQQQQQQQNDEYYVDDNSYYQEEQDQQQQPQHYDNNNYYYNDQQQQQRPQSTTYSGNHTPQQQEQNRSRRNSGTQQQKPPLSATNSRTPTPKKAQQQIAASTTNHSISSNNNIIKRDPELLYLEEQLYTERFKRDDAERRLLMFEEKCSAERLEDEEAHQRRILEMYVSAALLRSDRQEAFQKQLTSLETLGHPAVVEQLEKTHQHIEVERSVVDALRHQLDARTAAIRANAAKEREKTNFYRTMLIRRMRQLEEHVRMVCGADHWLLRLAPDLADRDKPFTTVTGLTVQQSPAAKVFYSSNNGSAVSYEEQQRYYDATQSANKFANNVLMGSIRSSSKNQQLDTITSSVANANAAAVTRNDQSPVPEHPNYYH
jgi:hypothetical protein